MCLFVSHNHLSSTQSRERSFEWAAFLCPPLLSQLNSTTYKLRMATLCSDCCQKQKHFVFWFPLKSYSHQWTRIPYNKSISVIISRAQCCGALPSLPLSLSNPPVRTVSCWCRVQQILIFKISCYLTKPLIFETMQFTDWSVWRAIYKNIILWFSKLSPLG